LRAAREAAGLTQREVARRLVITQSTISELENGQRRLDVAELLLLADLYGRPATWFLGLEREPGGPGDEPEGSREAAEAPPNS
jgi:transcriptional regulator with XRE-family HTH domain